MSNNKKLNSVLAKMVKTIEIAITDGKELPWQSPFYLKNMNRFCNPIRKSLSDNDEGYTYRGIFNALTLYYGCLSAEKRRGIKDHRFVPRFIIFGKNSIKDARCLPNPHRSEKESLYDSILIPVRCPICGMEINPDYNPEEKVSQNNPELIPVPKGFTLGYVINVADTNLVEIGKLPPLESIPEKNDFADIERAEEIINKFPHFVKTTNGNPRYSFKTKTIYMPPKTLAKSESAYYGAYFHELSHQIGDMTEGFATDETIEKYSKEELVAEFSATYVLSELGIVTATCEELKNNEAYIRGWLRALKDDPNMLLIASTKAQQRGKWLLQNGVPKTKIQNQEDFPFLNVPIEIPA